MKLRRGDKLEIAVYILLIVFLALGCLGMLHWQATSGFYER